MVETAKAADDMEVKKEPMVNVNNAECLTDATGWLMACFSNWMRLKVSISCFLNLKGILLERWHWRGEARAYNTSKPRSDTSTSFGGQACHHSVLPATKIWRRDHYTFIWESYCEKVRRILSSVLQQQRLDDDDLQTVMCEANAILNDQPITKLLDDPKDLEPLTPNHILLTKGKPSLPPGLFDPHDLYIKGSLRQVQYISDLFWKRWVPTSVAGEAKMEPGKEKS